MCVFNVYLFPHHFISLSLHWLQYNVCADHIWLLSFSLALSTALLWLIALLVACPKPTQAASFPTRTSPPPSSPSTPTSPGERTLGHRRAGTMPLEPTRLRRRVCGRSPCQGGSQGDGGGKVSRAVGSRSHSARNLWQSISRPPRLRLSGGTSVTLDGHTMAIQGKPIIVTLEEGQDVICEEHQLAPSRGTKVTWVSTPANTSR